MNVIISNQQDNILSGLDIEVIKSIQGEFEVDDIVSSFSNFFFSRMIIDVTALKDYNNILTYQKLSIGLPVDKIILLLPSQTQVSTNEFLSKLISMGYYNFTSNLEGINYLLDHPNSYKDVAHIHQLETAAPAPVVVAGGGVAQKVILGIKNVTDDAGATTLAYLIYKELTEKCGISCTAIETNKRDFMYFNDQNLVSIGSNELANALLKNASSDVIVVDLNDCNEEVCADVIYLVEPSIIKMNKLMKKDRTIFERLKGKKIVLNKCLLSSSDIKEFEREIGSKVFHVMSPFDDRGKDNGVRELLAKLGIVAFDSKK